MFVGTPGHMAALLSQQIAGRLIQENAPRCFELLSGAKNGTRRNKENQQDRSFKPQAERVIGKQAAAVQCIHRQQRRHARCAGISWAAAVAAAPAQRRSTLERSMHRSRNNRHCRPESAPAYAICCQQAPRAVRLSRAGLAPRRADGRDRRRPRSAAPTQSAPAPLRAFYGAKPSPSPSQPAPNAMVVL
jgi:hypothetical protein